MQSSWRLKSLAGLCLWCALSAWGQTSFTSVRGTVMDPSGAVVPGAKVEMKDASNGLNQALTANGQGEYQFQQVTPGTYVITASAQGFGTLSKRAELLVNQPATVDFRLSLAAASTTIDVSAEAQTLNDTDATIGNALNNATIEALPSEGRNVPDLLSIQPGVLYLGRGADKQSDSLAHLFAENKGPEVRRIAKELGVDIASSDAATIARVGDRRPRRVRHCHRRGSKTLPEAPARQRAPLRRAGRPSQPGQRCRNFRGCGRPHDPGRRNGRFRPRARPCGRPADHRRNGQAS